MIPDMIERCLLSCTAQLATRGSTDMSQIVSFSKYRRQATRRKRPAKKLDNKRIGMVIHKITDVFEQEGLSASESMIVLGHTIIVLGVIDKEISQP
jgi:hypothetical protein